MRLLRPSLSRICFAGFLLVPASLAGAQQQRHGRGYKPPPPTAVVNVTVEKGFNRKPFPNAAVIFHAERNGKLSGNLETKTDPDGRATLDMLEVGSHVTVQVIADGFATYATDFDLTDTGKDLLVKLRRPQDQVSTYSDADGQPSKVQPGVQERQVPPQPATTPAPPEPAATPHAADSPNSNSDPASTPGTPQ